MEEYSVVNEIEENSEIESLENNGEESTPVLPPVPALDRLTDSIKEQVQAHYIASIIYKDLQDTLGKRE